ncbi:MAG: arginine--tRNA ligase, partial [Bacteroidota bacterium]
LKKLGYKWAENCFHLSYGMVDLPTGKMKSREGTVVDADDLMDEVIEKATELTRERGHLEGLSESEKKQLFSQIGLGGLKYYLLKVDPKKRMMFNPEESIDLNGNTGPFIQYTYARIQSLLFKAAFNHSFNNLDSYSVSEEEKLIIKTLKSLPSIIDEAAKNYSPALIANFVYELVKNYNHFYQSVKILTEENPNVKDARLTISAEVAKTIKKCLILIGVEAPKRM